MSEPLATVNLLFIHLLTSLTLMGSVGKLTKAGGLSLTSRTVILRVVLSERGGTPLSVTSITKK